MRYLHFFRVSSSVAAILLVAACGGGDSISSPPANPLAVTQADVSAFVSSYKDASGSLEKLASPAFADAIDDGFSGRRLYQNATPGQPGRRHISSHRLQLDGRCCLPVDYR